MPVVPSCLFEPIWAQVEGLLPSRPVFDPAHPLGCHRRRIPDRVVFEHVVEGLVHGSGHERIASRSCSDRTIRRRVADWAKAGIGQALHGAALQAYDLIIGLELEDLAADGAITKAVCGGDKAGPSPVDRRKGGLKRSTITDAAGLPLGIVSAPANRHDSPLLAATIESAKSQVGPFTDQVTVHLDAGYDSDVTRQLLDHLGFDGTIARKGIPAPIQTGMRWVVERTNSWMNNFGKLRRCTERNGIIVDFYLFLAAAFVTIRQLIHQARNRYRWPNRPTTRRLK